MDAVVDPQRVLANPRRRWEFLFYLYNNLEQAVASEDVGRAIGITDPRQLDRAVDYLSEAGLIKRLGSGPLVAITPHGIDTVEEAIAGYCFDRATDSRVWGYIGVLALVCSLLLVATLVLQLWPGEEEPPSPSGPVEIIDPPPSASVPQ